MTADRSVFRRHPLPALDSRRGVLMLAGAAGLALAGCSLPDKPVRSTLYDFGPGPLTPRPQDRRAPLPAIALADVEADGMLDSTAVLYRLAYADANQLRPYAQARWSALPALLVRRRMREALGERRAVFTAEEAASQARVGGRVPHTLRVELDEFTHHFESPTDSRGVVRLRVTLTESTTVGDRLLGQRAVVATRPADSGDASGGVRALAAATDAAIEDIAQWLQQIP